MVNSALHQVVRIFNFHSITYWLIGGWAIDLFLGFVSRPHKDIDFLVLDTCFDHCLDLLQSANYSIVPHSKGAEGAAVQNDASLIDITKICICQSGSIQTFGIYETVVWPQELLLPFSLKIGNQICSILTLSNHIAMKKAVANWYANGQLRVEDEKDMQNLGRMGLL